MTTPIVRASFSRRVASLLERGALASPSAVALSALWQKIADPIRPVRLPTAAAIVGVGGATLGGAGKTPVVLELARALSGDAISVAVAVSAYRGKLGRARRIEPNDDVNEVGDEALWLARALAPHGVPVFGGRRRDELLELAATHSSLVVADALLQTRPERLALSVLVLDGEAPWGARRCPPAGDLRAARQRLLEATDVVVVIDRTDTRSTDPAVEHEHVLYARARLAGITTLRGECVPLSALGSAELGIALAIARPERVLGSLATAGVRLCRTELAADHGRPLQRVGTAQRGEPALDAWLTTPKCATKLDERSIGAPVWVLDHRVELPRPLLGRVRAIAERARGAGGFSS